MKNLLFVQRFQASRNMPNDASRFPFYIAKRRPTDTRERAGLTDSLVKIVAAEILHHDVDQIIVFVDLVDGDKVFVVDALLQ